MEVAYIWELPASYTKNHASTMIVRTTLIFFFALLWSCKSKEIYLHPKWKNNTEFIKIECIDKKVSCINETYGLTKIYESDYDFKIEHLGNTIFKGNDNGKTFVYEVYASKYLLIHDMPDPNNFASPFGHGEVFYLNDLSNKSPTYRFSINGYELYPFKPDKPIHTLGTKAMAFINNIDIEKREIGLLFSDLKTEEKLILEIAPF